jgi:cell division protein FtsL
MQDPIRLAAAGVRRRHPRWSIRAAHAVLLATVVLVCGLAHVWVRLQVTALGYGLSTARDLVARLEQEQRELEAELAMLTAPQRLAEEAGRRLRMREPRPGQVVVLR